MSRGKAANPTDQYRRMQKKREINKNKEKIKLAREKLSKERDPETYRSRIREIDENERRGIITDRMKLERKNLQAKLDYILEKNYPISNPKKKSHNEDKNKSKVKSQQQLNQANNQDPFGLSLDVHNSTSSYPNSISNSTTGTLPPSQNPQLFRRAEITLNLSQRPTVSAMKSSITIASSPLTKATFIPKKKKATSPLVSNPPESKEPDPNTSTDNEIKPMNVETNVKDSQTSVPKNSNVLSSYFGNYGDDSDEESSDKDSEEHQEITSTQYNTFSYAPGPRLRKLGPQIDFGPEGQPQETTTTTTTTTTNNNNNINEDLDNFLKEIDALPE